MKKLCENCRQPYSGRLDAKFCSDQCRASYHNNQKRKIKNSSSQKKTVTPDWISDLSEISIARDHLGMLVSQKMGWEQVAGLLNAANNPNMDFKAQAFLNRINKALTMDHVIERIMQYQSEIEHLILHIEKMEKQEKAAIFEPNKK